MTDFITRPDGVRIAFEVHGEGTPLLLIHGFPMDRGLWSMVMDPLSETHRVIALDLRGFGESSAVESATMEDYAADCEAVLSAAAGRERAVVCGLSMGGYIAFELVRQHPERLRALVIANSRPGPDTPEAARTRGDQAAKVLSTGTAAVTDAMVEKLFAPGVDPELKALWKKRLRRAPEKGVAAALLAMASRPDSRGTLANLRSPSLFIAGSDDSITPSGVVSEMADLAPGGRMIEIEGAAHMTPVEGADTFAAALSGFIRSIAD